MQKKIIGIVVCTLLIAATVLPVAGIMIVNNKEVKSSFNSDTTIEQNNDDSTEINEPNDDRPLPTAIKTGYLSIPPAGFTPISRGSPWRNLGHIIYEGDFFVAPVYLPHASIVTKLTLYWRDYSGPSDVWVKLYVNYMNNNTDEMALVSSQGWGGDGSGSDDTIDYSKIDNKVHSYYLFLESGGMDPDTGCFGVVIEYTYTSGGSSEGLDNSQQPQVTQEILTR